jgi:DHA2 family multidrug resistance protein
MIRGALARHSGDPVAIRHAAWGMLDRLVNSQALLLSFADVFRYVALAFLLSLPLLFLLGQGRSKLSAEAAGH